ncbi:ECF RNA polymerase sigma factor EcfG [Pseudidiomarina piscicola]|uniref:ECF RNA polymerase sigma factor EcfG n=1 Tax=Pseudidiomarina piscicola TaxID=2614830 RepID=A0A6S6WQT1_9GAMM|nr:RNA polymerase sigma factor [Pseudidiomarina piscicola]CAB0151464.1 ECF RNA polymerase sigma factor EcfG [Pseudidiomarina piscicola]VZT40943.1 ECF RNA polymerase sigma factor EcfG [Pseudomonas aeruginosa]
MKEQIKTVLPALRRFALSLTGNLADADDLLQSTVERLLSKPIPSETEIAPWAFKVCRNLWIDQHRAAKVRQNATEKPELQAGATFDNEAQVTTLLKLREVEAAMKELPEEQRIVLSLVAVQGLSYKETAAILGLPTGTIMSRLARARTKLAAQFDLDPSGAIA